MLLIASGNAASAACQGTTILFEDRFDAFQPSWGEANDPFRADGGQMMVAPRPAADFWRVNQANLYDDIDMCVTLTTIAGIDPEESKAGLVFWYVDPNNFYALEYAANGKASVWRRQRGKWLEQIGWKDVEGAKPGDGGANELRIVTRGDRATAYVNETELGEITGNAPDDGQLIGFFASSPEAGTARFAFDNLKVTRP